MPKKAKRPMRKFTSRFTATVEISLSERLLKEVAKPDWQANFYSLKTPQEVADHVAYNIARGASLRSIDGFAHFEDADVVIGVIGDEED